MLLSACCDTWTNKAYCRVLAGVCNESHVGDTFSEYTANTANTIERMRIVWHVLYSSSDVFIEGTSYLGSYEWLFLVICCNSLIGKATHEVLMHVVKHVLSR